MSEPPRKRPETSFSQFEVDGLEVMVVELPTEADTTTEALAALTPAERDVARLVLEGRSNREIADLRGTSEHTVAHQLRALYGKLGVNARAELAAKLGRH